MATQKEHKLLTKIIKESFKKAPKTSHNLATYHYDFHQKKYLIHNPEKLKFSKRFPLAKIDLVNKKLKFKTKGLP